VSKNVNDVGVRFILRTYSVFNTTAIGVASHVKLFQLKWRPFEDETHTPHPLPVLTVLYISPMSARQLLAPPVTVNRIFISHVGIAPKIGKFVKDNVRGAGLVIEYKVVPDCATLTIVATPELSDAYENAPELLDVGAVRENDTSANTYAPAFGPSVKVPKVG
jgi:hypothetical protein